MIKDIPRKDNTRRLIELYKELCKNYVKNNNTEISYKELLNFYKRIIKNNPYIAIHIHTKGTGFISKDEVDRIKDEFLMFFITNHGVLEEYNNVCGCELSLQDYPFHFLIFTRKEYKEIVETFLENVSGKNITIKLKKLKEYFGEDLKIILAHPCIIYSRIPCTPNRVVRLLEEQGLVNVIDYVEVANARVPFLLWIFFFMVYNKLRKKKTSIRPVFGLDAHSIDDVMKYRYRFNDTSSEIIRKWIKEQIKNPKKFLRLSKQGFELILRKLRPKYEHG